MVRKFTWFQVEDIRQLYKEGITQVELGIIYDVHPSTIADICQFRTYKKETECWESFKSPGRTNKRLVNYSNLKDGASFFIDNTCTDTYDLYRGIYLERHRIPSSRRNLFLDSHQYFKYLFDPSLKTIHLTPEGKSLLVPF